MDAKTLHVSRNDLEKEGLLITPVESSNGGLYNITLGNKKTIHFVGEVGATYGYKKTNFKKQDLHYGFDTAGNELMESLEFIGEGVLDALVMEFGFDRHTLDLMKPFEKVSPYNGTNRAWISLRAPIPEKGCNATYGLMDFDCKDIKLKLEKISGYHKIQPFFSVSCVHINSKDGRHRVNVLYRLLTAKLEEAEVDVKEKFIF
jgi:hypothetical protein